MAKTLANYDPLVQIPSGMTPAGADFPIVESHDILVGENDKRLDAKLDDIDSAIGNVGQTPIATQLSSKVNTGDIVTSVAATGSTFNNKIPSETAVRAAIEAKTINVDSTVTQGSTNAVSGGAVHTQLATKQDTLTFDTTPTASSSNPVTSGGVKTALDTKQDALTFDTTPTASSSNPVTSGGVKAALDNKQNTLTYETTPIVGSVNPVTSTGIRNAIDTAAAQNLGAMQAAYDTFSADISARVSSLSNGMVACSNIAAETTVGDTRILLYTGTTNSTYTNGHWYYNSAPSNAAPSWTDGGAVGSAPTIDNTLTVEGAAANSKAVGDAIENIVTISNTQPGSNSGNKVWIRETTNEEVQIPTYAEHIAKANKADIATNNESDNGSGTITASKKYAIGDHFYINNTNTSSENYGVSTLYKATAAIASGDAIVVGTNCEASKVADEITSLSNDIDTVKADLSEISNGKIDLLNQAKYYDGYYDATPAYTGAGTEGKVTGWGVVLIPVRKGDKIVISGMSKGGTYSAWLNSNNLSDIYSVFSSVNNDGEKICVTNWLALSVYNPANNYETYSVAHDIKEVAETFSEELDYVGNAISYAENAGYIAGNGSISSPSVTSQEVYTSKIPVKYQDVIGLRLTHSDTRSVWVAYALYDSNNAFLSRTVLINENASEKESNVTIASQNVAFIAFTYRTYGDCRMFICSKPYVDKDFLAENYLKKYDVGNVKYRNLEYAVKTDNLIDSDNPYWWIPESYIFWTPYIEYEAGTVLYANVLYLENAVTNSIAGDLYFYDAEYTELQHTSFGTLTPVSTARRSCDDETVKYVRFRFSTGVASIKPTAQEIANSFRIHLGTKIIPVLTTDNYYGIYTVPSAMDDLRQYCSGLNNGLIKPCGPRFAMHRGLSTEAPENTSPAFELAGQGGAWGIETDIWETTDGEFVCFHDDTVDRMTDGTGNISQMSIAQIEALTIDAGANIDSYPNLKIPTMSEYLSICRRYGSVAVIEIKSITNFTSMMEVIKRIGMEHSCVFLVPSEMILGKIKSVTDAPCAYLGYQSSDIGSLMNIASKYTDCWLDLFVSTATEAIINNAHSNNIPIITWTTDNIITADELIRIGVDVVTSNSITKL